jgi:ribosomal protein L18
MGRKLTREQRRQARVRRKLRERAGEDRLRLSVYRSHKYIYAQIIDDAKGHTLVAASSNEPEMRKKLKSTGDTAAATVVLAPDLRAICTWPRHTGRPRLMSETAAPDPRRMYSIRMPASSRTS